MSGHVLLAHLSDLHLLDLHGTRWWQYANKRASGAINLALARRHAHSTRIAQAAVEDVQAQADQHGNVHANVHTIVTGDLSNLAFDSEFRLARRVLAPLIPGGLSLVPGNHDVYLRGGTHEGRFLRHFGDLLGPPASPPAPASAASPPFPWIRRLETADAGHVALVGLSSVHPTPPLFAHGRVAEAQLDRLRRAASQPPLADASFRVAALHHNLHPRGLRKDWMHGLRDRDAVLDTLAELGFGLVLHGHTHRAHQFRRGPLWVMGCGSTSWDRPEPDHVGRYNLYEIRDGALASARVRVFDRATGAFTEGPSLSL